MSTNRRKVQRTQTALGPAELMHLTQGCCLLGSGCQLCTVIGEPGNRVWVLNMLLAKALWTRDRDELMAQYTARLEQRGESGPRFPVFASALFDPGAEMPGLSQRWPADVRKRWETVTSNLAILREYLALHLEH
jgi:hypothetical protein